MISVHFLASFINQLNTDNPAEDSKQSLEYDSPLKPPQDRKSWDLSITCEGRNLSTPKPIVTRMTNKLFYKPLSFGVVTATSDLYSDKYTGNLETVMVNFTRQCNWAKGYPDITLGCLWGCFWMRLTFELVDGVQQICHPIVCSLPQSVEDQTNWIEPKGSEEILSSWWCVLAHWSSALGLELTLSILLLLRPLQSDWNYTRGLPRSPAFWLRIQDFSASIIMETNSLFIYACMCVCDGLCFSGEPRLIQRLYQSSVFQFSAVFGSQCCFSPNYMSLWEIERIFPRKLYIHFPY